MIASTLGYSRQHCYNQQHQRTRVSQQKNAVKQLVDAERRQLPRLGTRKLFYKITPHLKQHGLKIGRDKLFAWMKDFDLLIKPKRRYVQTTDSKHWLRKYPNLVKDITIERKEQVWVSDITYVKTQEGTIYLTLITDAFSRRIMGYHAEQNMEAVTVKKALEMALTQRTTTHALIHHSDRGLQYCSKEYVGLATANDITMSMTENGDPYENALAERMNLTLKEEFGLYRTFSTKQQAKDVIKEAVDLYNDKRPHLSLHMQTPNEVHQLKIPVAEATGII